MKKTLFILSAIFGFSSLIGQATDKEILLKINNSEVTKDEFLRIYNKNKGIEADNKLSVDEYLQLFINYKLKVEEAENLGYDTVPGFIKEINGYKKQLSKPYLESDDVVESKSKVEYERMKEEINASHILVMHNFDVAPKDTMKAYNQAQAIRKRLIAGEPFEEVAKAMSDDKSAIDNGGNLGWFSAQRMVDPFEDACYKLKVGDISDIVRTQFGYHIIKLNGRRPYKGTMNISHVIAVFSKNASDAEKEAAKQKIDKAYADLQAGVPWDTVAVRYSEHKNTAGKGGKLGWVNSYNVPSEFNETIYDLNPGEYTKPFASRYGQHIARLNERKPLEPYDDIKSEIAKKVKSSPDFNSITKNSLVNRIKNEYGFKAYEENVTPFNTLCDSSMLVGKWDYTVAKDMVLPVFTIGDKTFNQYDFAKFIAERRLYNRSVPIPANVHARFNAFIEENVIGYEEDKLPSKYPDLRYLLEEYHDGILLFNLTENMVWKKAIEDTVGLTTFYNQLPEKYSWSQRISISKYTYSDSSLIKPLLKLAKKSAKNGTNAEALSAKLCPNDSLPCVSVVAVKYEKGDNSLIDSIEWKPGSYLVSKEGNKQVLFYVNQILSPEIKKLTDAKGLYTADYQNFLEKNWIESLRNKYNIQVNNEVLDKIKAENSKGM